MSQKPETPFSERIKPSSRSSTARSFTDQEISRSQHLVHKLKAKDTTGRWAYYFILVPASRTKSFLAAINGDGNIDLEDFGKVLASCYGEKPTQEIKDFLKERYGFDVS
jgi:hypothetical protein